MTSGRTIFTDSVVRQFALTIATILIMAVAVEAADKICDRCGREITESQWVEFDGCYFHTHHFVCDRCGADLRKGAVYTESGRMYDSACHFELYVPKCDYCGLPIQGNYTEFESKLYHQGCYERYIGPRCAICGEAIYGDYLIDMRGNATHPHHENEFATCDYCGSFLAPRISGGGKTFADGRKICGLCFKSAVTDIGEARERMTETIAELARHGIHINEKKIPLELIDRRTMSRKAEGYIDDPSGFTSYKKVSSFAGIWTREDFRIYLLSGMPRAEFVFTLAHELMHVWLFKNALEEIEPALREGSCQYAGILVVGNLEDDEAQLVIKRAMEDDDPVYGDGLRGVDEYVDEAGVDAWLEYLKRHARLPN